MNMKRRYIIMKRDIKGFILDVLSPIILLLIGLIISKVEITLKSYPVVIDLNITGKQNILFASILNETNISSYFINDSDLVISKKLDNFKSYKSEQKEFMIEKYIDAIFELSNNTEDSIYKEIDMTSNSYTGYYSSLLILEDNKINKFKFIMALNSRVKHCVPIYSHFFLKSINKRLFQIKI